MAQTVQNGVPVLVVLFFDINALTLAEFAVEVQVQTLTARVDIRYTCSRRAIRPLKQLARPTFAELWQTWRFERQQYA